MESKPAETDKIQTKEQKDSFHTTMLCLLPFQEIPCYLVILKTATLKHSVNTECVCMYPSMWYFAMREKMSRILEVL